MNMMKGGNRIAEYYDNFTRRTDYDLMNNWILEESIGYDAFESRSVWTHNYVYHFIGETMRVIAQ